MKLVTKNKKINIKICNNFFTRLKGFMFKKNINNILCFPKCNSIHTFFMFKKIDVIMTNKENKVLYIYNNLKPFKIILPKKNVYYTYELPNKTNSYKINEKLIIEGEKYE